MASKRRIRSKDIVPDILSGMSDAQLMKKYKLSPKGLRSAFTKLLKKGCLEVGDLYHRVPSRGSETIVIDQLAHLPQNHLTLNVPIEDLTQPGVTGTLWYVTDRNFAVTGIQARHGEKRSFSVPCREYLRAQAITFEAECLWTSKKSATDPSVTRISHYQDIHRRSGTSPGTDPGCDTDHWLEWYYLSMGFLIMLFGIPWLLRWFGGSLHRSETVTCKTGM